MNEWMNECIVKGQGHYLKHVLLFFNLRFLHRQTVDVKCIQNWINEWMNEWLNEWMYCKGARALSGLTCLGGVEGTSESEYREFRFLSSPPTINQSITISINQSTNPPHIQSIHIPRLNLLICLSINHSINQSQSIFKLISSFINFWI